MAKTKQDWSPREGEKPPGMHIVLRFDMQGRPGQPAFNLKKVKEALISLANSRVFNEALIAELHAKGQDAVAVDGEVGANYFTFE